MYNSTSSSSSSSSSSAAVPRSRAGVALGKAPGRIGTLGGVKRQRADSQEQPHEPSRDSERELAEKRIKLPEREVELGLGHTVSANTAAPIAGALSKASCISVARPPSATAPALYAADF